MRSFRATLVAVVVLAICGGLPAGAAAVSERVSLGASFTPDKLGASTALGFNFQISTPDGSPPSPLIRVDLHLPAGIDYLTTTLGLAICEPAALLLNGPSGCSPNSRIGTGSAIVDVPFAKEGSLERPSIEAFMGSSKNNNIVVLFYADGKSPVSGQVLFTGELVPGFGSVGGSLDNAVPLVAGLPEGPDVSILDADETIGPSTLLYEKRVHGKVVHFRPEGVSVPEHCPHGGFPFQAQFSFEDGSDASASTTVPCPSRRR